MRILCTGDTHLTDKQPKNRTDNFPEAQYKKLSYLFDTATKQKVDVIAFPGDIFDSFKVSNFLMQQYIDLFLSCDILKVACLGQHDQKYHSKELTDTPISVLQSAKALTILDNKHPFKVKDTVFYSASWGEDIPDIETSGHYNILLTHRMVIKNKKLWEAQEDYCTALSLLKNTDFDVIVSGDNHQSFLAGTPDKGMLFNCGSIMRSNYTQMEHKPVFYILNTDTTKYSTHYVPIESEVFSIDTITKEKEKNEKLLKYVNALQNIEELSGLKFERNIKNYCDKNSIESMVVNEINSILNKCA